MAASILRELAGIHLHRSKLRLRETSQRHIGSITFVVLLFSGFGAPPGEAETIRYVAVGDSYTICQGVAERDCWPALLTRHLVSAGIDIELLANPSQTGWKVEDAIRNELPVFEEALPTFATLMIGVNDWIHGSGRNKFTSNLTTLIDRMRKALTHPERLLILTIPDFSCAPRGETYGYGRNIAKGISKYNAIIQKEAKDRALPVVDIFPLSQTFCNQEEMFVEDGIHPSTKQYALWEQLIFKEAYRLLKH
jgi:acyl-CoA thioesterase I